MTAELCATERNDTAHVPWGLEPRCYATGANRQIDALTRLLLEALHATIDEAARLGATDTGARRAAAALVDARIAVHQAVTAAGRVLADRERTVNVPGVAVSGPTAA
jgi:hypothetical protein